MKRSIIAVLAGAAISVPAMAGSVAWAGTDSDDRAETRLFLQAPHDISAAIGAAETAVDGKAIAAEFDDNQNAGYYEIETVANGRLIEVKVDAASGQVTATQDEGDVSAQDDDDIVDPAQLGAPLADLVSKAEAAGEGRVMAIGMDDEGNAAIIEVELAADDGSTQDFILNPADGKLTPER